MRTTLTLLLSRSAASTSGAAMSRNSASVSASRRIEGPSSAAATGLALARPSTSASISIRTKRESGELIVCPSHRRSERRMKAWLAPVHPNVRCHQPRRGPSPEASASSLSAVGTGASAAAASAAGSSFAFLARDFRAGFAGLASSAVPAGSVSAGTDSGAATTSAALSAFFARVLRGLGLRLRRSFHFRDRWLFLDRALDHGRAVRFDSRFRRGIFSDSVGALAPAAPALAIASRSSLVFGRPLGSHLGGVLRRPLAGLQNRLRLPSSGASPPSRRPRPRPPRRLRRRRRPGRSSCS